MGKTVALDRPDLAWAHGQFAEYYRSTPVDAPPRTARREFATFAFTPEPIMRRHVAFRTSSELAAFLADDAPRHVYYSSAYYRLPDHLKMDAKVWLGADLIFDLDADHVRGSEGRSYVEQLELVKSRLARLLDDFLFSDFGVDPAQTRIVFSGGRGYHVHVLEERFQRLTSPERRELVEYVQGTGLDPGFALRQERGDSRLAPAAMAAPEGDGESRRPTRSRAYKRLYDPSTPGWRGKGTRGVLELLTRWEGQGAKATAAEIERWGVGSGRARSIAKRLVDDGRGRQIRESLSLDVFPGEVPAELLDVVLRHAAIEVQGETDAPVTTDVHRLIRLPGSLHGGTGFRVVPLDRDRLAEFDPFRSALIPNSDGGSVEVVLREAVEYPFEPAVRAAAGETVSVPTAVGLFLILRGEAQLPPGPAR